MSEIDKLKSEIENLKERIKKLEDHMKEHECNARASFTLIMGVVTVCCTHGVTQHTYF